MIAVKVRDKFMLTHATVLFKNIITWDNIATDEDTGITFMPVSVPIIGEHIFTAPDGLGTGSSGLR
ncbi:MAG: hypothetical protein IPI37_06275 [Bacteroidales bacterium]|nr:hypothetical protein [Bacteroidales bacterium]